jgi:hypothetical protein
MAKLCKLRQLLLESIVPEFAVLAQMQELKRLELRVSAAVQFVVNCVT